MASSTTTNNASVTVSNESPTAEIDAILNEADKAEAAHTKQAGQVPIAQDKKLAIPSPARVMAVPLPAKSKGKRKDRSSSPTGGHSRSESANKRPSRASAQNVNYKEGVDNDVDLDMEEDPLLDEEQPKSPKGEPSKPVVEASKNSMGTSTMNENPIKMAQTMAAQVIKPLETMSRQLNNLVTDSVSIRHLDQVKAEVMGDIQSLVQQVNGLTQSVNDLHQLVMNSDTPATSEHQDDKMSNEGSEIQVENDQQPPGTEDGEITEPPQDSGAAGSASNQGEATDNGAGVPVNQGKAPSAEQIVMDLWQDGYHFLLADSNLQGDAMLATDLLKSVFINGVRPHPDNVTDMALGVNKLKDSKVAAYSHLKANPSPRVQEPIEVFGKEYDFWLAVGQKNIYGEIYSAVIHKRQIDKVKVKKSCLGDNIFPDPERVFALYKIAGQEITALFPSLQFLGAYTSLQQAEMNSGKMAFIPGRQSRGGSKRSRTPSSYGRGNNYRSPSNHRGQPQTAFTPRGFNQNGSASAPGPSTPRAPGYFTSPHPPPQHQQLQASAGSSTRQQRASGTGAAPRAPPTAAPGAPPAAATAQAPGPEGQAAMMEMIRSIMETGKWALPNNHKQ